MNPEDAKRILLACRPDTADEAEPDVREALALVAGDPALAHWWQEQRRIHTVLRDQFRHLPVPANLKDQILARQKTVTLGWWRGSRFQITAAAAVLMVLFAVLFWRPSSDPDTFALYRDRMVRMVIREYRMDVTTSAEQEIRAFLRGSQGHADYRLPAPMADVPLFGAGRLTWQGKPVSMICFERRADALMYLFVIDRTAFAVAPDSPPEFAEVAQRPTVSWTDGSRLYVLASETDEQDLRSLFP